MKTTQRLNESVTAVGRGANHALVGIGSWFHFGVQACRYAFIGLVRPKIYPRTDLISQVASAGARSMPIIVLISSLIGMTLVAQTTPTLETYGTTRFVAGIVGVSITRTLGPVLTAIVFTGRVGAAYTAELGTMKVSDELLALETMGVSSIGYLAAPRVMAGTFALLALTVLFDLCALASAYFISITQFGVDSQVYLDVTHQFVDNWDFGFGLFKAAIFSLLISIIACYKGFNVRGSGIDVGKATMEAVVACLVVVIFSDFVLSLAYNVAGNIGLIPS